MIVSPKQCDRRKPGDLVGALKKGAALAAPIDHVAHRPRERLIEDVIARDDGLSGRGSHCADQYRDRRDRSDSRTSVQLSARWSH